MLKRLLFRRQGLRWFLLSEPEGRLLHLDDRRLQVVHQFRKKRTYVQRPAPLHAVDQALRLRLQPALNQRQRFQVVRILLGIHLVLFSNQLERGADDLFLLPAQRFLRLSAAAGAGRRLGLGVLLFEGSNLDEIDIG